MVFSLETLINKCKLLDLIGRVMMICWLLMSAEHKLNANIKCCIFEYFLIAISLVMIMLLITFSNHSNISWITSNLSTWYLCTYAFWVIIFYSFYLCYYLYVFYEIHSRFLYVWCIDMSQNHINWLIQIDAFQPTTNL